MPYSRKNKLILFILCLALLLVCFCCSRIQSDTVKNQASTQKDILNIFPLTEEDDRIRPDDSCNLISFNNQTEDVVLSTGGDYRLTGNLRGSVIIRAEDSVVHLFLDGVTVHSVDKSAFYVESAGKMIITLCENSENSIVDAVRYSDEITADASVYSPSDITLNGSGSLTISARNNKAIHSRDLLKVIGCNLLISSPGDAIQGNDGILVLGGSVTVETEQCGLKTRKNGKAEKGSIVLSDCMISVTAGEYGLSTVKDLWIDSTVSLTIKAILADQKIAGESFCWENAS